MFFKRQYKYIFLLIPLVVLYRPFLFFGNYQLDESVGSLFLSNLFGGSYSREKVLIVLSITSLFGVLFLNILFGDYICRDFLVNGEYIFSRQQDKGRWFLQKAGTLCGYCLFGTVLVVGMYAVGSVLKSSRSIDSEDAAVMAATLLMVWEFSYVSTLLINLLALFFGTSIAFVIAYSGIIGSEILASCLQGMGESTLVRILHGLNPMSNMTISWNYSDGYIAWSVMYFLILIVVMLVVGKQLASGYEIGIRNSEL